MRTRWLLVLPLLVMIAPSADAQPMPTGKPESVGMSSQRLERIGQVLRQEIVEGRLPGAVVAVARKGKIVYYESFGFLDKNAGIPVPKDAVFGLASLTKPLTAVGALALYEEGRLQINDPVGKYLPGLDNMAVAVMSADGQKVVSTEPARRKPTLQAHATYRRSDVWRPRNKRPLQDVRNSESESAHRSRVSRSTWQTAAALSARHDVGLQPRFRCARVDSRVRNEAVARSLS